MNKFVEIKDKKQLDEFMDHVWNFHDAVISKINFISGSHGSTEGTYPIDDKRILVVRFESLHYNEAVINALELKFEKLGKAFIAPSADNATTNIMCAKIEFKSGNFIFVNDDSLSVDIIDTNEKFYYYIAAEKLFYKIIK